MYKHANRLLNFALILTILGLVGSANSEINADILEDLFLFYIIVLTVLAIVIVSKIMLKRKSKYLIIGVSLVFLWQTFIFLVAFFTIFNDFIYGIIISAITAYPLYEGALYYIAYLEKKKAIPEIENSKDIDETQHS